MSPANVLKTKVVTFFVAGLIVCCANAARNELPPEVTRAAEIYTGQVARIVIQYEEAIKGLPKLYQAELAETQKKQQASGDLDGVLAMSNEIKRFNEALEGEKDPFELIPEMPESALVAEPAILRAMQDGYLKRYKDSADTRDNRLKELTQQYINNLAAIQKEFTKRDRIADAVLVRNEAERLKKIVAEDQFAVEILANLPPAATLATIAVNTPTVAATTATENDNGPVYGNIPNWSKWEYLGSGNYAQEGFLFAHPDMPDELFVEFSPRTGRGRIYGRCYVDRQVVDMRERLWFGKALMWRVPDAAHLTTTIQLTSKELSVNQHSGPSAQIAVFADQTPLQSLTVNLMSPETTLRVVKDVNSSRVALMWVQGKRTEFFTLPESGVLRIIFSITVRNPGERCDTTIVLQKTD
jgi:hypothetical protein